MSVRHACTHVFKRKGPLYFFKYWETDHEIGIHRKKNDMKYKAADTQKLIDVFGSIEGHQNDEAKLTEALKSLTDYPVRVLEEFLHCIDSLEDKINDQEFLKENYWGIIGYITIRLNLCEGI